MSSSILISLSNTINFIDIECNLSLHPIESIYDSYQQELPSRCKKDVLKAAAKGREDYITIDGLEKLLINIDAKEKVTRRDVEIILSEVGGSVSNPTIKIDQMIKFM